MHKSILLLLCLFVASCATEEKKKTKETAVLHFNIAVAHLESGRYPEALKQMLTAYDMDPENPMILNNLGLAYFVREKYLEAQKYISQALKIKPDYTDARNNLGRVLAALGRYEEATEELERVLKDLTYTAPEKALTNLGFVQLKQDNFEKAKKTLAKAIQSSREYCPAYNYYGQALFMNREYNKASDIFDRALRICERVPEEVHYFSALSYYKAGLSDKAIARFEEVVKNYPESEFAQKSESMLKIIKK